jgi:DNA-binding HxlR family transcriptional regulator
MAALAPRGAQRGTDVAGANDRDLDVGLLRGRLRLAEYVCLPPGIAVAACLGNATLHGRAEQGRTSKWVADPEVSVEEKFECPVEATLAVIGGKWKAVLIFHMMDDGPQRFAELRRKTRGISDRILSRQLRELESDGIVHREVFAEVPPRVEYSLTEYGQSLRPVTEAMCQWGKRHMGVGAA